MGVGFALVYLPLLAILTVVAVILGKKLWLPPEDIHPRWIRQGNVELFGAFGTPLLLFLTLYGGAHFIASDGSILYFMGLVLLLGPFLVGFAFILGSHFYMRWGRPTAAIVLNRAGIGSFHAVWGLPGAFLFYYAFVRQVFR